MKEALAAQAVGPAQVAAVKRHIAYLRPPMPNLLSRPDGVVVESYDIAADAIIHVAHDTPESLMADLDARWLVLRASLERWARLPHEERQARLYPVDRERC